MPTTDDLRNLLEWTSTVHRPWKQRILTADLMAQGKWSIVWPDLSVEERDPLVENAFLVALEDKSGAAAAINPFVNVAPLRGSREDRAERSAQKRRRAFVSIMEASKERRLRVGFCEDWLMKGAQYGHPWKDWRLPPPHQPYFVRVDPRHVFPIAHNAKGELSVALIRKLRRTLDLLHDYGTANEGLMGLLARIKANDRNQGTKDPPLIEEAWYMDEEQWGIALVASSKPHRYTSFRYVSPTEADTTHIVAWAVPPHPHRLDGCPLVEVARATPDGEYRGALDAMIPNLKVAQTLMARLLQDVERSTFAPVLLEGIENPEEWGPNAILRGTGDGRMKAEYARPPMDFAGWQHMNLQIEQAKNTGKYPRQRSGDFGASIASAKATASVMGAFNVEQAWLQSDLASFYQELLGRAADFDQHWCGGRKEVTGMDEGEIFSETYDASTFWKDDFRVFVGFHAVGIDEQQLITRLAMAKNLGALSTRSMMRKSGIVDNPLNEEREIALEIITQGTQALMLQQAAAGNDGLLNTYNELVDSDDYTIRGAAREALRRARTVNAQGQQAPGLNQGNPGQVAGAAASLEAGGIPGNAERQGPQIREGLASMLPRALGPG